MREVSKGEASKEKAGRGVDKRGPHLLRDVLVLVRRARCAGVDEAREHCGRR